MPIQKRSLKRRNSKEKTISEKLERAKRKIDQPRLITDSKKINQIKSIFEETRLNINKLREIRDPIKEKILRHKIFLEFEKRMKEQGFSISFQKTKEGGKSATELFYDLIARDYYNHTTKSLTNDKMESIVEYIDKIKPHAYTKERIKEYVERCYYESMYFIHGEAAENSFKLLERRLEDIPSEIKTTVVNFLVKEYMSGYNKQIREYLDNKKIESDIVANAYANLAIRISFLEML